MRISDWSSDVCSSDLLVVGLGLLVRLAAVARGMHVGGTAGEQQAVERVQQVAHLLALRHGRDDDRRAAGGFPDGAGILVADHVLARVVVRSEEHTSELHSLMRISYAVFCLKKKKSHS